jgi:hypothetical protein
VLQRLTWVLVGALVGYLLGAIAGGLLVSALSGNSYDREQEIFTTALLIGGPIGALLGAGIGWFKARPAPLNPGVLAVGAGVLAAAVLTLLVRWLMTPLFMRSGVMDIQTGLGRAMFLAAGAVPAVVGGYIAARLAPDKALTHAVIAGGLLCIPALTSLPAVLHIIRETPQSPVPIILGIVLKPVGAVVGAVLTGRARNVTLA